MELLRLVDLLLESLGVLDLLTLLLLLGGVLLKFLGQVVNLWRILASRGGRFEFGIGRLIEIAELQLILLRMVQQLWRAGGSWVQRAVMLLVRRRRWRIMRHLGQHPVFDLEL